MRQTSRRQFQFARPFARSPYAVHFFDQLLPVGHTVLHDSLREDIELCLVKET